MKTLRDFNFSGRRVLLRADFNVSLGERQEVLDDFRIRAVLPTLTYLVKEGARIIIAAHLGRPLEVQRKEGRVDIKKKFSLESVRQKLAELLGRQVILAADCLGPAVEQKAFALKNGEVLMLENVRFYEEEEENSPDFAQKLAALAEIYINDAFGVSHRSHASVEAITRFLPSGAGLLLQKEIETLTALRDNFPLPLVVVLGGFKISTKLQLITSFLDKADHLILGGALANTILHAQGLAVGRSLIEEAVVGRFSQLKITSPKLHLPVDGIWCASQDEASTCHSGPIGFMQSSESIFDIGPDTEKLFVNIISAAKTVIWNGPMGMFEKENFGHGTLAVAESISHSQAYSVVGGGETIAFLEKLGLLDKFSFVSSGGGAMMEFLAGDKLPGIEALK